MAKAKSNQKKKKLEDIADQVLQADLKNIIAKVQAGKTLTKQERDLVRASAGNNEEKSKLDASKWPKHTKSDRRMCEIIMEATGIAEKNAYRWLKKMEATKDSRGWKVHEMLRTIESRQNNRGGGDGGLKDEKLKVEIRILETKLKQMEGELISYDDHLNELREHASLVNHVFDQWISEVSALTKDSHLVAAAERLRDGARARLEDAFA